jgi:uncharacterized DUF497 family protein
LRYNFEWDPEKARQNLHKHKVSFERAAEIFLDPLAISIFDEGHSIDEERWVTMGRDKKGMLMVVIHTFVVQGRNKRKIRIISARKASMKEAKQYEGETI